MPRAAATVDIHAPLEVVSGVILELERYPEFLPHVSRVLPRPIGQDTWDVDFHLDFIRELHYTLKVWRESPGRIRWSMVEGVFRRNDGAWELEEIAPGVTTRVRWWVDLQFDLFLPNSLIRTLAQEELPGMLEHFKRRAEAMWSAPMVDVDASPTNQTTSTPTAPESAPALDAPMDDLASVGEDTPPMALRSLSPEVEAPTIETPAGEIPTLEALATTLAVDYAATTTLQTDPPPAELPAPATITLEQSGGDTLTAASSTKTLEAEALALEQHAAATLAAATLAIPPHALDVTSTAPAATVASATAPPSDEVPASASAEGALTSPSERDEPAPPSVTASDAAPRPTALDAPEPGALSWGEE